MNNAAADAAPRNVPKGGELALRRNYLITIVAFPQAQSPSVAPVPSAYRKWRGQALSGGDGVSDDGVVEVRRDYLNEAAEPAPRRGNVAAD